MKFRDRRIRLLLDTHTVNHPDLPQPAEHNPAFSYKVGYMYAIQSTKVFDAWFLGLRDRVARARIQARIDRAEDGNFGDSAPVGEGVSEMRIHHGPGYRIYFKRHGMELIILLAGGDKTTQAQDIKTALTMARELQGA